MARSDSYGKYAGQPVSFACAKCRRSRAAQSARMSGMLSPPQGRRFTTTGRWRPQTSQGANHHRWPSFAYEYKCLDCGHVGWSRHPDVQRRFRQLQPKENTMDKPTDKQIEDQMDKALTVMDEKGSAVPGMSYEEGVEAALRWVLGHSDEPPIEDE